VTGKKGRENEFVQALLTITAIVVKGGSHA